MSESGDRTLNRRALDPHASVVVEACAGSGKTWLLVSRILRLLLAGAQPSQILAITFTRKSSQEMAARLNDWLEWLATATDAQVREFLVQREVPPSDIDGMLGTARTLYERLLSAHPPITITTFHAWFLRLLRSAPLDAGALGDATLVEQTAGLVDEAWQRFATGVQRSPGSPAARGLEMLFAEFGLDSTRRLLTAFLTRRAEWCAYTAGRDGEAAVRFALAELAREWGVDPQADPVGDLLADAELDAEYAAFAGLLERNTESDRKLATELQSAVALDQRFAAMCRSVLTDKGEVRKRKASDAQARRMGAAGERRLLDVHERLAEHMLKVRATLRDQRAWRFNEAGLHCGIALLAAYGQVKRERQVIDYADIEWHAWRLVSEGDNAIYMQHKLDSRYRHVLVDEFQDTNPLQWLVLKAWFRAAAEAGERPTVFLVGDPKQSIYRFRRAEARLFSEAAAFLEREFGAARLGQDESRRCPPAVIEAVNRTFGPEPAFEGFQPHYAHHHDKPGRVVLAPLAADESAGAESPQGSGGPGLRNPLQTALDDQQDRRREREAGLLVEGIRSAVGRWDIWEDESGRSTRRARYRDILVLVRRRTHLEPYERALRRAGIPYLTSRQGGLLETLEALDLTALLEFLVAPFADLKLAHALRTPLFDCSDEDLTAIAAAGAGTWWERLDRLAAASACSGALTRAHRLLRDWLGQTDRLPVHDQLDRIYFEGDVLRRYEAAVPAAMRSGVLANLEAFIQHALDTDSGRYPSLPRFLDELRDLRAAPAEEAPDEGIVGDPGDAVRIFTVHGAKGLQAPIVWVIDSAAGRDRASGYDAMVTWDPAADAPRHFSLWSRKDDLAAPQAQFAAEEARLAERENLNLLYVAMTRAQQVLVMSGCDGRGSEDSWFGRVRAALREGVADDPRSPVVFRDTLVEGLTLDSIPESLPGDGAYAIPGLSLPRPTGERRDSAHGAGVRFGTDFHRFMELATDAGGDRADALRERLGLTERTFARLQARAQKLLAHPRLQRFFDPRCFLRARNELSFVLGDGSVGRIDRVVEFADEIWVLDYKSGAPPHDAALERAYQEQLATYRAAIGDVFGDRRVRAMLVYSDGSFAEIA